MPFGSLGGGHGPDRVADPNEKPAAEEKLAEPDKTDPDEKLARKFADSDRKPTSGRAEEKFVDPDTSFAKPEEKPAGPERKLARLPRRLSGRERNRAGKRVAAPERQPTGPGPAGGPETAEEMLRHHEQLFRLIARNLPGGAIAVVDRDLRYVAVDGPLLEKLGLTRERMEGRLVREALTEPPRSIVEARFSTAVGGETASHETDYPDHTVWSQYVPLRDEEGHVVGAMNLALDITERKADRRTLEEREAELRLIVDSQPALISYIDSTFRYRRVNRAYEEWLGGPASEIQGRHVREVLGEEAWEVVRPYMERAASGEAVTFERELPYPSGPRWVQATYRPDKDPSGRVRGFVVLVYDVARQKRAEQALLDADMRKNEFLATLSHELRNPLAPIRYALELLRRQSPELGSQPLEIIDRQLRHMVHLVDDLLDATRIATGKIHLNKSKIRLDAVAEHAVEATLPEIERAGHHLSVLLPPEPVWFEGDPSWLAQVLTNLLSNATRHTPPGGRITLRASASGGTLQISVADTGVGLSAENIGRVFEMFTQVGRPSSGGLGIGLALVKEIVSLHGGQVEARSEGSGKGAEFVVRLPLAAAKEPGDEEARSVDESSASPLGSRRILIVDDNDDAASLMQRLLSHRGHDVQIAGSGQAALAAMRDFKFEVGLFDIGLPDMSGYDLARHVRDDPSTHEMCLIAVTGWGQREDRERSRASGFDAHVTKPAEPEHIERLIAEAGARS